MRAKRDAIFSVMLSVALTMLLGVYTAHAQTESTSSVDVTFPDSKGETRLTGFLYRPDGPGPFPAVVLLHGCSGITKYRRKYHWWATTLQSWGYVALLVDSLGPRGEEETCSFYERVSPIVRVLDAHGALQYLQSQPYVDPKRIGAIGWSHGGWTVLLAVDTMLSKVLGLPRGTFRAAVAFYPPCDKASFNTPLLILIGKKDDWTRAEYCENTVEQLPEDSAPVTLKVYPDAYHSFDTFDPLHSYRGHTIGRHPEAAAQAEAEVKRFLAEHLAMKPKTQ